jgi:hypothetical protein
MSSEAQSFEGLLRPDGDHELSMQRILFPTRGLCSWMRNNDRLDRLYNNDKKETLIGRLALRPYGMHPATVLRRWCRRTL